MIKKGQLKGRHVFINEDLASLRSSLLHIVKEQPNVMAVYTRDGRVYTRDGRVYTRDGRVYTRDGRVAAKLKEKPDK